ncbi:YigZ family protein [Ruania suaedae]|uniref:IMPACT family protein n=1 Tax=Ruania suaedae TaxID=2897774 RepID=UPI001E2A42C7|nr:YigZ family protein [Ruania suaedae]UFU02587.1 YigZ family protein [Ruania suaedae]
MTDLTLRGGSGARIDAEIEVRRSRFLCRLVRVGEESQARAVVDQARTEHHGAGHHCSAFALGPSGPQQVRRSHDDGEPSGTAGSPMLEVLTGAGLIDCVAVVTRYFGGVLLGAGGLVRAYSDAVTAALERARRDQALVARVRRERAFVDLPHDRAGRIEAELRQHGVIVLGTDYGERARLRLAAAPEQVEQLRERLAAATAGSGELVLHGQEWIDVEIGAHHLD